MQVQQDQVIGVLAHLLFRLGGVAGVVQDDALAQGDERQRQAIKIDLVVINQQQTGIGGESSYRHAGSSLACPVLRQDVAFVLPLMIGKRAGRVQSTARL